MKRTRCLLLVGREFRSCHPSVLFHLLVVILLAATLTANAEQVVEAFRTPFGEIRGVSVNPTNSSVWVASGGSVMHLAADGSIIGQINGFGYNTAVAANPSDGSCWVTNWRDFELGTSELVHLAADGTELLRLSGFRGPGSPCVNPADGSCWVTDWWANEVVHIAADGTELLRVSAIDPLSLSLNSSDGSCWVADNRGDRIIHLAENGTVLWQTTSYSGVHTLSVNASDGSVWAVSPGSESVIHLGADGTELWRGAISPGAWWVGVNETDGSCWVSGGGEAGYWAHLAEDGTELLRVEGFSDSEIGSVDPTDGTLWIGDAGSELVHLAPDGTELSREGRSYCGPLSVNTVDGSCWTGSGHWGFVPPLVAHVGADGTELWRGPAGDSIIGLSVDAGNGSCWVADNDSGGDSHIVHLAEDGTELWRGTFVWAGSPSVNPTDGSCWFIDSPGGTSQLIHLAEDGTELLRVDLGGWSNGVAVNPADGTVWVSAGTELVHLAKDGTQLWRGPSVKGNIRAVSVVAADGSCWYSWQYAAETGIVHLAADGRELGRAAGANMSANGADGSCWMASGADLFGNGSEVVHFAANGAELWRGPAIGSGQTPYAGGTSIAANSSDGSAWAILEGGQLARLVIPGWRVPRFYDVPPYHWAFEQVEACVDANIVKGYDDGLYHPEYPVTRDQMAVYIARALVSPSGDAAIPDPEPPPSFSDVPPTHWAYKHIEYAVSQNVVKGYDDGTYQPSLTVDRGQMAVYVARAMVAPGGDAAIPDPVPPATFPDVPDSYWAYKQVEYCVGQGVVKGYDDGNYHPANPVTRDQMAVYIARAFALL